MARSAGISITDLAFHLLNCYSNVAVKFVLFSYSCFLVFLSNCLSLAVSIIARSFEERQSPLTEDFYDERSRVTGEKASDAQKASAAAFTNVYTYSSESI